MRTNWLVLPALLLPAPLAAQDAPPPADTLPAEEAMVAEAVPSGLAESELERTRMCVPALARIVALEEELQPLAQRADRLRALSDAILVEDPVRVSPLDDGDPVEEAVREWFATDEELGRRYAEEGSDAVAEERRRNREAILQRIREAMEEIGQEVETRLAGEEDLAVASNDCEGAVLVRSAVLEECETVASPVCEAARRTEPGGPYRFVDSPEDLWDIEQMRPWTQPSALQPTPDGGLGGARTAALTRRGNLTVVTALEPLIQQRGAVGDEEAQEFDANLEALGISFDHPGFVMAPAFAVEIDLRGPLGGETHYLLHFGDLSNPAEDVFWVAPAGERGPIRGLFPAEGRLLEALASGEEIALTAIRIVGDRELSDEEMEQEVVEANAVFSLGVTPVGQAEAVQALLSYMADGQLSSDLAALIPPSDAGDGR